VTVITPPEDTGRPDLGGDSRGAHASL